MSSVGWKYNNGKRGEWVIFLVLEKEAGDCWKRGVVCCGLTGNVSLLGNLIGLRVCVVFGNFEFNGKVKKINLGWIRGNSDKKGRLDEKELYDQVQRVLFHDSAIWLCFFY